MCDGVATFFLIGGSYSILQVGILHASKGACSEPGEKSAFINYRVNLAVDDRLDSGHFHLQCTSLVPIRDDKDIMVIQSYQGEVEHEKVSLKRRITVELFTDKLAVPPLP